MPINAQPASFTDYDACRLNKPNARSFTVQVATQTCAYQLNVAPFGRGEAWMPAQGAFLAPGLWNFTAADWAEYGVATAQGIRFRSVSEFEPAIITAS